MSTNLHVDLTADKMRAKEKCYPEGEWEERTYRQTRVRLSSTDAFAGANNKISKITTDFYTNIQTNRNSLE